MLQIWDVHWSLDVDQCPCDVHFVEWLEAAGEKGKTIFHFGTGGHHHVGLANLKLGGPNNILAITASPKEYDAFIELAIANPHLSRNYQAYFGDIYLLNPQLLPSLDIVTLFHLCEFRGDSQDAYDALTDRQVTEILLDKLAVGGKLLLFTGSFAYPDAKPIADALADQGRLRPSGSFKSLEIYDRLA